MSTIASTVRPRSDIAVAPLQVGDPLHADNIDPTQGVESMPQPTQTRMNRIAIRAHEIYEARGGQHGMAMDDWLTAERQIDDEIDRVRNVE